MTTTNEPKPFTFNEVTSEKLEADRFEYASELMFLASDMDAGQIAGIVTVFADVYGNVRKLVQGPQIVNLGLCEYLQRSYVERYLSPSDSQEPASEPAEPKNPPAPGSGENWEGTSAISDLTTEIQSERNRFFAAELRLMADRMDKGEIAGFVLTAADAFGFVDFYSNGPLVLIDGLIMEARRNQYITMKK